MIQFYTMPLTTEGRSTLIEALLWIEAVRESSPLAIYSGLRNLLQAGAESIELDREDWIELQADVEQWGMQDVANGREALRFANAVDDALRRNPSRTIEETVKVAAPAVRQPSLFGDDDQC